MTVETDNVLSAIRRGEDSLPKLRAATGLEYAKLHPILHELEFEWRSIRRSETADGFDRYAPMPSERTQPLSLETVHTIPPAALNSTRVAANARELALLQRNAPYCIGCHGLCVPHGTDRNGKARWRCRVCEVTFAGSGVVKDLNRIAPEKREAAISAFNEAKSVRQVAAEVGISKVTAAKIRDEEKIEALCPCGKDAKHQGWCPHRFQNSPARQATVEKMNMAHIDPHEEAEKKIAEMVERGRVPSAPLVPEEVDGEEEVENWHPGMCHKCGAAAKSKTGNLCSRHQDEEDAALAPCRKCSTPTTAVIRNRRVGHCQECYKDYIKQRRAENAAAKQSAGAPEICGCGRKLPHGGRCSARRAASSNGHAPKSGENITETITGNGRNAHNVNIADNTGIARNPDIIEEPKTGNSLAGTLRQTVAEKEAQIAVLEGDIVALKRTILILEQ